MYWHTNYYVNISVGKIGLTQTLYFFCNSDNDDIVSHAYEVHYHNYTRSILFDIVPSILLYVFYWVIVLLSRIRIRNIQKETTKIIFSLYKMKEPFTISGLVAILSLLLQV